MTCLRAAGDLHNQLTTGSTRALVGAATPTIVGSEQSFVFEIQEGLQIRIRLQHHMSTMPSVPTGGTASRHILFTPEGGDAVTATPSPNCDPRLVDELHGTTGWPESPT